MMSQVTRRGLTMTSIFRWLSFEALVLALALYGLLYRMIQTSNNSKAKASLDLAIAKHTELILRSLAHRQATEAIAETAESANAARPGLRRVLAGRPVYGFGPF